MKAVVCHHWGWPEDLEVRELPSPSPKPGEIHVAVQAAGLNFADTLMIAGRYQDRPPLPFTPGFEFAGDVLAVGDGVHRFRAGDRVAAWNMHGAYAQEAVVPAANAMPIPDAMDYPAAAAFTIAYGTSYLALEIRAKLQAGEVILVHGAAGGVGLTAVELGARLGATVIATAGSAEKLALAESYGATHLINYRTEDFVKRVKELTDGRGADVIYDPVGGDVFDRSLRCLNTDGRLVTIGFAAGRIPNLPVNVALLKNISLVGAYWGGYALRKPEAVQEMLGTLMDWYAAGVLKPHISKIYPMEEVATALNALIDRKATGRLVLRMQ